MRSAGSTPKPIGVAHAMSRLAASTRPFICMSAKPNVVLPSHRRPAIPQRRDEQSDDACGGGHNHAFDQQPADAVAARRAERGVDGQLMTTGERLRDRHAGDIRTRHDDDEHSDEAENRQQDAYVEPRGLDQREHGDADALDS